MLEAPGGAEAEDKPMYRIAAILSVAFFLLFFGTQAAAQPSLYTSLRAGASLLVDGKLSNSPSGLDAEAEYEDGLIISGALGVMWDNGFRAEGEISYSLQDVAKLNVTNPGNVTGLTANAEDVTGEISSFELMANIAYDFHPLGKGSPYFMAGIGTAQITMDGLKFRNSGIVNDEAWVFAYQAGAGFRFGLMENLSLDLGYRYFSTVDIELKDSAGDKFDFEYERHTFLLGLMYRF